MNVTNSDINNFVGTVEAIKTECEEYLNECMEYHRQTSDLKDECEECKEECETYKDNCSDFNDAIDAMHLLILEEIAVAKRDIPNINNSLKREIETLHENTKLKNFWANCFLAVSIFVMTINIVILVVS